MDEQLDNDLKNRIREVFDNYEDPSADEGWLLLRKKFPEQEKRQQPAWLWWGSIAAAMLLFLGIGLWVANKKEQPQTFAVKPVKQQPSPAQAVDSSLSTTKAPVTKPTDAVTAPANTIAKNQPGKTTITPVTKQPLIKETVTVTPDNQSTTFAAVTTAQPQPVNNKPATVIVPVKPIDSVKNSLGKPTTQQYAVTAVPPTVKNGASSIMFNNAPNANNTMVQAQQPAKPNKPPLSGMDALLARESKQAKKEDKHQEDFSNDKKVRFGVYAATFFNYAKGSNNQVNAGAGFTSDIKLSKNLRLSTGVALAQNTLSYNSTPPQATGVATALALNSYDNKNALAAAGIPLLKNYSANLVGIDVPVNLKYEFNPQKSDTYVSAGLSSGTFINEAYTAHYTYPGSAAVTGVADRSTDEVTRNNFNGFYLAKTLNVAFGVGYPVGKTNKLIIEPFLKYPLDGLGAQQLKFGAGGINLKFNFTGVK